MKVYVVKAPQGEYEEYCEPIFKIFFDKAKAEKCIKEENAKLPLEQVDKCNKCLFKWSNQQTEGKQVPSCARMDKYNNCQEYFKFLGIHKLFIEEHEVEE